MAARSENEPKTILTPVVRITFRPSESEVEMIEQSWWARQGSNLQQPIDIATGDSYRLAHTLGESTPNRPGDSDIKTKAGRAGVRGRAPDGLS